MQSQLTDELRYMRDKEYQELGKRMAMDNVPVEEVDNERGGKTLRVPHEVFTTWSRHLDNQVEKRRRQRKAARASKARNRR